VDLSKLVGGQPLTLPCTISKNGLGIKTRTLIDTGANGFIFIDTGIAGLAARHLDADFQKLDMPYTVKGFDGGQAKTITHYLELNLHIDRTKQAKLPMLVVKLGGHDMILGRAWTEKYNTLVDCRNRQLIWPDDAISDPSWNKVIATHKGNLYLSKPTASHCHQQDADRRDELLDKDTWRPQILCRTQAQDQARDYKAMEQELRAPVPEPRSKPERRVPDQETKKQPADAVDICGISAAAFRTNLKRKDNILFCTSLDEIDRIIIEKKPPEPSPNDRQEHESETQWLKRILPKQYGDYADTFSKEESDKMPPSRSYDHKIHLDKGGASELGFSPLYHQSAAELEEVKRYLVENLAKGFIVPSQAPFASPVLFVKKPTGGLRFCIDYRKLNQMTKKDRYPLPLIDETLGRLAQAKVFTKLDIRQAFHRIRIHEDSQELTTFRTRYGAYKCKVLPFGLTNGPATYQRYMNDVLFDYLDDFCTAYLDDILIYSEDPLEHEAHVKKVLDRLRAAGLQADIKKSEFSVTRTKYLGFIISTTGIEVDPEKVSVVKDWKEPKTVKGVQSFLGFCNFYRRFIADYGRVAKPLNQLTRKDTVFQWDTRCQEAFQQLKDAMLKAPVLEHYYPERLTMVETDASDGVVGGVLSQQEPMSQLWHPIAYFSKTMQQAELNYDIHDKEMLAIILAVAEWRAWLQGLQRDDPFQIYSDHRALEYFMTTKKLTGRQARWAELLSQYHFRLAYRTGKANGRADALSRKAEDVQAQEKAIQQYRTQVFLPREKIDPRILEEMGTAEDSMPVAMAPEAEYGVGSLETDTGCSSTELIDKVLQENRTAKDLQDLRTKASAEAEETWTLKDGLLLRYGKLYVPDAMLTESMPLRTALIKEAHEQPLTGHPGRAKLRQLLQSRYYWPGQGKHIDQYVANCYVCRRSHVPRDKKPGLLHQLPVPDRPWQHITVDFKKCPESKTNHNMVAIFVDRLSKRPITIPVRDTITAKELAPLFILHVVRHVGIPDTIVSDRGPQFVSDFWNEFCTRLQIKLKLSTANHPQTDGQTEIVNQYFDQRLRPYVNHYQDDWDEWVAMVDYQQSSLLHETTGQSPFMTEKGYEPRTSFDWEKPISSETPKEALNRLEAKDIVTRIHDSWEKAKESMSRVQERYARQANKHRRDVDFEVGDKVWVSTKHWKTDRPSRKLADQQSGPYEIIEQVGHSFRLRLPDSIKVYPVFHADRLRKAPEDPLPGQKNDGAPAMQVNDQEEYEVQEVLAVKLVREKLKYRIKWKGWDEDPEWYPASVLANSPLVLRAFHTAYPLRPGPPRNLRYWLQCAQDDVFPDGRDDDDRVEAVALA
jgi:transposase InsO family protein